MLEDVQGSREEDCCGVHHVHQVSTPPCSAASAQLPALGQHDSETLPYIMSSCGVQHPDMHRHACVLHDLLSSQTPYARAVSHTTAGHYIPNPELRIHITISSAAEGEGLACRWMTACWRHARPLQRGMQRRQTLQGPPTSCGSGSRCSPPGRSRPPAAPMGDMGLRESL